MLVSSRSRCERASRASAAFRSAAWVAPAASSWAMSRIFPASSAAARTTTACWLARSVRSPVVLATSCVEAVISWVEAAISSDMAAASWACWRMVPTRSRSLSSIAAMRRR